MCSILVSLIWGTVEASRPSRKDRDVARGDDVPSDTELTRQLDPELLTFEEWLRENKDRIPQE